MNLILDKMAYNNWYNKMKELNDEYKNRITIYYDYMIEISQKCKYCSSLTYMEYNSIDYPLVEEIRRDGIYRSNVCNRCKIHEKFIPFPINY